METKFKIGDKVKIISPNYMNHKGEYGIIIDINPPFNMCPYSVKFKDGKIDTYNAPEMRLMRFTEKELWNKK